MVETVQESLRDRVGRALYEEPGANYNWHDLSEERREPWRKDADRVIPLIAADYAAVEAEKLRAQEACRLIGERLSSAEAEVARLHQFIETLDRRFICSRGTDEDGQTFFVDEGLIIASDVITR